MDLVGALINTTRNEITGEVILRTSNISGWGWTTIAIAGIVSILLLTNIFKDGIKAFFYSILLMLTWIITMRLINLY